MIGKQGLDIKYFTIGVWNVHQNYLCTVLLSFWYAAPSCENFLPSFPRWSLPRCSWGQLECLDHIWIYVPLLGTKMRSLEATSPENGGDNRGQWWIVLREIILLVKFWMKKIEALGRHVAASASCWNQYWRRAAKFFTDCQAVFLISWGLVPGIRSNLLIPRTNNRSITF